MTVDVLLPSSLRVLFAYVNGRTRRIIGIFLLGLDPWKCYAPTAETVAEIERVGGRTLARRILAAGAPRAHRADG